MRKKINKNYIYIGIIVLLTFLITSNIAWLNPAPDKGVKIKFPEKIPFMWQYNLDAGLEIKSAAFFPDYFREDPSRVSRPVYPFLSHTFGFIATWWVPFFIDINPVLFSFISAATGYVILHLLVCFIGGIILFKLLREFIGTKAALLTVALMYFHKYFIMFMGIYHTGDLQFLTAVFATYMLYDIAKKYSHKKNIIYSFIIGTIYLSKQVYAIYLAIILFALINKRFKETGISIISQFMPLAIWLVILKIIDIPYFNLDIEANHLVWIFNDLIFRAPVEIIKVGITSMYSFFIQLANYYSFWLLLPGAALVYLYNDKKINRYHICFILIFFLSCFAQMFAADRYLTYMVGDLSFVIFGLSAFLIVKLIRLNKLQKYENRIILLIILLWLFMSLISILNLPWVHPYDHIVSPIYNTTYLDMAGISGF
ncbi:MAG: glycosyltransferase family 39 protein [Candidatus Aenigmarchaeota archaeon]|nr:glycosyltransferase family 39 protein [Candidatus Aenigmarchaeota archaeon]